MRYIIMALAIFLNGYTAACAQEIECKIAFNTGTQSAPQILAFKNGWFKAPDVDFIPVDLNKNGDIEASQALIAQDANIGVMSAAPAIIALASKTPCLIICSYATNNISSVYVSKSSDITKPGELNGKKIGVASSSSEANNLSLYLKNENITAELIDIPQQDLPNALKEKKVSAIVLPETALPLIKTTDISSLIQLPNASALAPLLLVGSGKFVKNNPEAVKGLVAGTLMGVDLINSEPKRAANELAESLASNEEKEERILRNINWKVRMDKEIIQSLNETAKVLLENGIIDSLPDIEAKSPKKFIAE